MADEPERKGVCLVLGGAASVWDDVHAALELGEYSSVVGCNDVGVVWPGVMDAWVSLHCSYFGMWSERRRRAGHPPHKMTVGHAYERGRPDPNAPVDLMTPYKFAGQDRSGSSGLFALKVALEDLGFDKAVLCGVPMDPQPHFFDGKPWDGAAEHQLGWTQSVAAINGRARSMSGWTATLLGKPTEDWLSP